MTDHCIPVPVDAIVRVVEYLHEEREHYEDCVQMGDSAEYLAGHIQHAVQALSDWLDAQGIPHRDIDAEGMAAVDAAFAACGVRVVA